MQTKNVSVLIWDNQEYAPHNITAIVEPLISKYLAEDIVKQIITDISLSLYEHTTHICIPVLGSDNNAKSE